MQFIQPNQTVCDFVYCYIVLGSRDVINGEEYVNDYDGYDGPGDPKRLRPKKHKTKKTQRYLSPSIR